MVQMPLQQQNQNSFWFCCFHPGFLKQQNQKMLKQQNQNMFWFCCFRKPGWKQENRFGNTQNQKSAQNKNRDSPTVMESGSPEDGGPDRTSGLDSMLQQQRWTIRWLVWSSVRQQPIQTSEPDLKASWVLPASQFSADPVERHGAGNPVASSTELTAGTEVKLKGPAATESTSDYQFCYTVTGTWIRVRWVHRNQDVGAGLVGHG